ncbi:hypothetical protein [Kribbella kalugense]|uniref:Uncharacterized protein n=1 Tax=Kribbella kalugense TaxID=2512221 RepID=A0A4R8A3K4_9ACTN|nr:hypothetical protein [Kribbella kalugense]TDW24221.1 hypothetical protein EV650_3091 [Kribbella kalugense]
MTGKNVPSRDEQAFDAARAGLVAYRKAVSEADKAYANGADEKDVAKMEGAAKREFGRGDGGRMRRKFGRGGESRN